MASAAEQLAQSINFGALSKATELKQRIWFTLGALVIYRLGTYIPAPGIDPVVLEQIFDQHSGGILGIFDMFAGGALGRMTIFALNIMPYISAAIIMQLLTAVSPSLEQLKKEGEAGRKKINQYTRYGTVLLAAFQSYGIAVGLESTTGAERLGGHRSGTVLPIHDGDHADRRHDLPDVAGRADHPARRWQRHLADHLLPASSPTCPWPWSAPSSSAGPARSRPASSSSC